ncbi:MAG TPA: dienelactone hydrolase family protein [Rectinemataceae bacterium]|nr:dienelactone hydrolase family protein [Rectinemataceae bacterium]
MPIHGEWISYGDQSGYFAFPERATKPLPSVIVIQEIWGVNAQIEELTKRIAAAGYAALAPDLFSVDGKRPPALEAARIEEAVAFMGTLPAEKRFDPAAREEALGRLEPATRARISETHGAMWSTPGRLPALVAPLRAAVAHLRHERSETKGQSLGCVGFCMGGGLSALLACEEPELDAAAIFYGSSPPAEKVASIACPVIGFYGAMDQRVNAGVPGFAASMREAGKMFEYHVYEGANHAFFNETGAVYDVNASRDAWARLMSFYSKHLAEGKAKESALPGHGS